MYSLVNWMYTKSSIKITYVVVEHVHFIIFYSCNILVKVNSLKESLVTILVSLEMDKVKDIFNIIITKAYKCPLLSRGLFFHRERHGINHQAWALITTVFQGNLEELKSKYDQNNNKILITYMWLWRTASGYIAKSYRQRT